MRCIGLVAGAAVGYHYRDYEPAPQSSRQPSSTSEIGGQRFIRWYTPRKMPEISFEDENGKTPTIPDFHGRVVLLNVWATWCAPCRKEMPSLDRLGAKRGGPDFEVVALSIDHDSALVRAFYLETDSKTLRSHFDRHGRASAAFGAFAVPTTLLIDRNGLEVGRALGEAE